ncbi:MAG: hypothetical protein ACP5M9_00375 [Candidatus Micrarchaeia archaeon]
MTVILRYKEYIEQNESIYLPDLPKLIDPTSSEIAAFISQLSSSSEYSNDGNDILKISKEVFKNLEKNITIVLLPIQFWQKPEETLKNKIGDELDYYALLCSIFIALGTVSSKVLIVNYADRNVMSVYLEYNNELILFQHNTEPKHFKSKALLLKYICGSIDEEVISYEFNDKIYRDITLPLSFS